MTSRNCDNCGKALGPSEQNYSYLGRTICQTCKIKLDEQIQALTGTGGDSENEIPSTYEQTERDSETKTDTPIAEKEVPPLLSDPSLPRDEELPDSQSPNKAPTSSEQQKLPRRCRSKRKVLWFAIGILILLGLFTVVLAPWINRNLRDSRPQQTNMPPWGHDDPIVAAPNEIAQAKRLSEAGPLDELSEIICPFPNASDCCFSDRCQVEL